MKAHNKFDYFANTALKEILAYSLKHATPQDPIDEAEISEFAFDVAEAMVNEANRRAKERYDDGK